MNYSSAWNGQTKVALDSLQKSQLGIRFHNGFIHWRQAGDEVRLYPEVDDMTYLFQIRSGAQCYTSLSHYLING